MKRFIAVASAVLAVAAAFTPIGATTAGAAPAPPSSYTAIDVGYDRSCAMTSTNTVECWGETVLPAQVALPGPAASVSVGRYHACAVLTSGSVWCWGVNGDGQLGDGTTVARAAPVAVAGLPGGAVAVSAGDDSTCAALAGGGVSCWGANASGELGDGGTTPSLSPVSVAGLTGQQTSVAVGDEHACALGATGAVKCWGDNLDAQLGDGTRTDRFTAGLVSGLASGVASISAGSRHTCAVTTAAAVRCWGDNRLGQLGDGTTTFRRYRVDAHGLAGLGAKVSAGDEHTCAVTTGGAALCWGDNAVGMLGDGTRTARMAPTPVSGLSSGIAAIAGGVLHSCAVEASGKAWCWGQAHLGDGTQLRGSNVPVRVDPRLAFRPDGLLTEGPGAPRGDGIYNNDGSEQSTGQVPLRPGTTRVYTWQVQNDGQDPDAIALKGLTPPGGYTVNYTVGGTDVSAAVRAGTYAPVLDPGQSELVTVTLIVPTTAAIGDHRNVRLTATSQDGVTKDVNLARFSVY